MPAMVEADSPQNVLFDELKRQSDERVQQQARRSIKIAYQPKDGGPARELVGESWETTPLSIARQVSLRSELDRWIAARVNGVLCELEGPLGDDCTLELLDFDDHEGKQVFWRSSTHILGNAAEQLFGCLLNTPHEREDGFMHEWSMPQSADGSSRTVTKNDYKQIHLLTFKIINRALPFESLRVGKPDLIRMFAQNKYRLHAIEGVRDGESLLVYRCGLHIDICSGPLLASTGKIKAFEIISNSSSYFLADANNDSLQRMQGISFPSKQALDLHKVALSEAAQRDHRKIGREQELFFFDSQLSPGSAFFLPSGQNIYNAIMTYIQEEYWRRGYQQVTTPNIFKSTLWKTSGHWEHYRDDMFRLEIEKDEWALKPMNCPGHCVMFKYRERSYRELPLRISEFGVLHRNEISGALTGLTRVRRFVQDDTHIFCTPDQVQEEVQNVLDWITHFYHRLLGFRFKVKLSTMPEKHLGDLVTWQKAESQLIKALDAMKQDTGVSWVLNPGDGAFYGPKIDVTICDALNRDHQCASIQLDFQLPQQFQLQYRSDERTPAKTQAVESAHKSGHTNGTKLNGHSKRSLNGRAVTAKNDTVKHSHPPSEQQQPEACSASEDELHNRSLTLQQKNIALYEEAKMQLSGSTSPASNNPTINQPEDKSSLSPEQLSELEASSTTEHANGDCSKADSSTALAQGFTRPVMIHRGILGSFERLIAILCEHFSGNWPFWLSPRQILIIPVTAVVNDYAQEVKQIFRKQKLRVDLDLSRNTISKKIQAGQKWRYNFIFVVGRAERDSRSVNVRNRDDPATQRRGDLIPLEKALHVIGQLHEERTLSGLVSFK